ncbi:Na+/H+ antiporter subunit E [Gemmatimonadota bacterium]
MRSSRYIVLFLSLFGFWFLLSGYLEPLILAFGAGSAGLVTYVCWRMDRQDRYTFPFLFNWRAILYMAWLVREIFRANVNVARIILDPKLPISPIVVPFRARMRSDLCRFIYANSITLTPGTITTWTQGEVLRIHALTWREVDGREEDDMAKRICAMESGQSRAKGD